MNTTSDGAGRADYELHVQQGPQRGARMALAAGRTVSIGAGLDSDIVLRPGGTDGPQATPARFMLRADGDRLRLQVLNGEVRAGERRLGAGVRASVALDTPLEVDGTRVLVDRTRRGDDQRTTTSGRLARWAERGRARRLAAAGATLLSASIGALAFAYAVAPRSPTLEEQAGRARAVLAGAGLSGLSVDFATGQGLRIGGEVASSAERARAERLLATQGVTATWQVQVNELLGERVHDVFRAHGVAAEVQTLGAGTVRVSATTDDPLALERVAAIARRDVPGLRALELDARPAPQRVSARPLDDPGKRVASIVAGDPAYVVTADGTRYFLGAMLPTGHRIASIDEHQVVLELGGETTSLAF